MTGFILSGKPGKHGKVREFKVIWKTHGKVREISKKSSILTFFWKITNFNTNIKKKSVLEFLIGIVFCLLRNIFE
jgi:hypothetical protein